MRLIDADLVVEKIKAKCNSGQWAEAVVFGMEKALYLVKTAPTVERPHGRWIIVDDCEHFIAKCSVCGRIEDSRLVQNYLFCHCGADMREGDPDDRRRD